MLGLSMAGLKVVLLMVMVMVVMAEESPGEPVPAAPSSPVSRVSRVRMPKLSSSRNPAAAPRFSDLVAAHSEPVPSFRKLLPSSSEQPEASPSSRASPAAPSEPLTSRRESLPLLSSRNRQRTRTSESSAAQDEPVPSESKLSASVKLPDTRVGSVPVRTLVRVSKVLVPTPRPGIARSATFIPRNRFPDIKKHRPSPADNVIVGKSPCPRGTRGATCRRQLALDAFTCTSGTCRQCRKDCSTVSPSMWPTCCRDHFLCCRHLASACQKCDSPQLFPFCSAAFKKCY